MLPNLVSACNGLGGLIPPQPHTIQQLTPLALFTLKPIVLLEDFLSGEKFTNPFIKYLCHCFPHRALKNIILHVTLNLFLHHNLYKCVLRGEAIFCHLHLRIHVPSNSNISHGKMNTLCNER